ncbi:TlpA disulfide reductase family protein [Bernardetia sp. MNP-M8]|uniref:TlpA disulfide reductase family protein n=1 Tax=Bernardetia sp. MNP-M8 TaxID=3127470 RepID=UPI0030D1DCCB
MKYFVFVLLAPFLLACSSEKEKLVKSSFILPSIIYQDTEVSINAIRDSININTDSLFFHIDFFLEDLSVRRGFIKVNEGVGKFTIPSDAAYFFGYFYNLEDSDTIIYERVIYNGRHKPALNSFQNYTTKERLESELSNYPNNIIAYANHVTYLRGQYYKGQISDTLYREKAISYLDSAKAKFNPENASHLSTMAILYSNNKQLKNSQKYILELLNNYPNSNFLHKAMIDYNAAIDYEGEKSSEEYFFDSVMNQISKKYPNSFVGMNHSQGFYNFVSPFYKDRDIIYNNVFWMDNIDSTRIDFLNPSANAYIYLGKYDSAMILADNLLEKSKNNYGRHKNPMLTKQNMKKMGYKQTDGFIADAYALMSDIEVARKNYNKAVYFINTSVFYYRSDTMNQSSNYSITYLLKMKATLYKRLDKYSEALKIYDTLYQNNREIETLDSIKVLFKETEQEKGFESYAKNLKERVENENQETKKLAADFSIKDMSGYEIKLSEWKERVVVLNFWANYCLPCAKEIPYLNKIWRETQTDDIIFLAVTKNTPLEVTRFAQRQKEMFSFSILPNAKELADVYDVNLVPTTIVINKKGEIVHKESGFSGNIDKLKQVVLEELAK